MVGVLLLAALPSAGAPELNGPYNGDLGVLQFDTQDGRVSGHYDRGGACNFEPDRRVVEGLFEGADVVVRQRMVNRRIAPTPMEGRVCAAAWDGQRLTFYASTQGIGLVKETLEQRLGLAADAVRVVCADVGGGFGSKGGVSSEELLVAWLALRLGGTVRWAETRSENLTAMGHGRGQVQDVEIGATRDGKVTGLRMHITQEAGAYADAMSIVSAGSPAPASA